MEVIRLVEDTALKAAAGERHRWGFESLCFREITIRMIIFYDKKRRRLWIFKARVHHGLIGAILTGIGLALIIDDFHDFPWLRDTM